MLSKFHQSSHKAKLFFSQNKYTSLLLRLCSTQYHPHMANTHSKIASLYQLCKKTFSPSPISAIPPPAVYEITSLLDTICALDVGLKEENLDDDRGLGISGFNQLNRVSRLAQPITYLDICESDSFTMCVFLFPTSAVIPLHDHPGMTVFSRVLYGSLHVKAYDWIEPACFLEKKEPNYQPVRLAKLTADKVLTPECGTSILYPKSGGNLHCFTAVTPCAVLDILTPPYRADAGRKCSYYMDYHYSSLAAGNKLETTNDEDNYAWLAEIDAPDDFYMNSGRYNGPPIHD